jgi:hypothetical protein
MTVSDCKQFDWFYQNHARDPRACLLTLRISSLDWRSGYTVRNVVDAIQVSIVLLVVHVLSLGAHDLQRARFEEQLARLPETRTDL